MMGRDPFLRVFSNSPLSEMPRPLPCSTSYLLNSLSSAITTYSLRLQLALYMLCMHPTRSKKQCLSPPQVTAQTLMRATARFFLTCSKGFHPHTLVPLVLACPKRTASACPLWYLAGTPCSLNLPLYAIAADHSFVSPFHTALRERAGGYQ